MTKVMAVAMATCVMEALTVRRRRGDRRGGDGSTRRTTTWTSARTRAVRGVVMGAGNVETGEETSAAETDWSSIAGAEDEIGCGNVMRIGWGQMEIAGEIDVKVMEWGVMDRAEATELMIVAVESGVMSWVKVESAEAGEA